MGYTHTHTHTYVYVYIYIMCTNWYSEHKKHYEFCPEMMDDSPNVFPTTADVLSLSRWYTLVCFMVGHFGHWWHQTPEVFGLWPGLMCLRRNSHQQPAVGSDFIRFPIFQIFQVPKNISFVSWRIHAHPSMAFHGIPWQASRCWWIAPPKWVRIGSRPRIGQPQRLGGNSTIAHGWSSHFHVGLRR